MHLPVAVDRVGDSQHDTHPKVPLVDCPTCRFPVPENEVMAYAGRKMCRNCIAAWFDEDDAEDEEGE